VYHCQKLSKSAQDRQSYCKNKKGAVFLKHSVEIKPHKLHANEYLTIVLFSQPRFLEQKLYKYINMSLLIYWIFSFKTGTITTSKQFTFSTVNSVVWSSQWCVMLQANWRDFYQMSSHKHTHYSHNNISYKQMFSSVDITMSCDTAYAQHSNTNTDAIGMSWIYWRHENCTVTQPVA